LTWYRRSESAPCRLNWHQLEHIEFVQSAAWICDTVGLYADKEGRRYCNVLAKSIRELVVRNRQTDAVAFEQETA
jgi:hypothetical protein